MIQYIVPPEVKQKYNPSHKLYFIAKRLIPLTLLAFFIVWFFNLSGLLLGGVYLLAGTTGIILILQLLSKIEGNHLLNSVISIDDEKIVREGTSLKKAIIYFKDMGQMIETPMGLTIRKKGKKTNFHYYASDKRNWDSEDVILIPYEIENYLQIKEILHYKKLEYQHQN